ncbi:MAG TPA: sodium-independent anion transporter, partial [Anaerolineae bacterium]
MLREIQLDQVLTGITAGLLAGVLEVLLAISYAALIFSGNLSEFAAAGIGLSLFSTVVLSGIVALRSSLRGSVAAT